MAAMLLPTLPMTKASAIEKFAAQILVALGDLIEVDGAKWPTELTELGRRNGQRRVERGVTRVVLVGRRWAVKIPAAQHGTAAYADGSPTRTNGDDAASPTSTVPS